MHRLPQRPSHVHVQVRVPRREHAAALGASRQRVDPAGGCGSRGGWRAPGGAGGPRICAARQGAAGGGLGRRQSGERPPAGRLYRQAAGPAGPWRPAAAQAAGCCNFGPGWHHGLAAGPPGAGAAALAMSGRVCRPDGRALEMHPRSTGILPAPGACVRRASRRRDSIGTAHDPARAWRAFKSPPHGARPCRRCRRCCCRRRRPRPQGPQPSESWAQGQAVQRRQGRGGGRRRSRCRYRAGGGGRERGRLTGPGQAV